MDAAFAITRTPATPEQAVAIKKALEQFDFIARILTPAELAAPPDGDVVADLFRHSYRPDRVTVTLAGSHGSLARLGLVAVFKPHVITEATANHGSPYEYDRHVPLIFYGANVQPGSDPRAAHTTDVAPTLAALGGIASPRTIDGRALLAGGERTSRPLRPRDSAADAAHERTRRLLPELLHGGVPHDDRLAGLVHAGDAVDVE